MEKGTLGKPKFTYGDKLKFEIVDEGNKMELEGTVEIVDSFGTFFQTKEPSYDIMVDEWRGEKCLFKHIRESNVLEKVE